MESSWDQTRARSQYHFDAVKTDPRWDRADVLGRLPVTWQADLNDIISRSRPATWATRGYKGQGRDIPPQDLRAEQHDLERVGADSDMVITNLTWAIPPSLQAITQQFALGDVMERIHVQWPGQVWTRHIDKLEKWSPEDPTQVLRVFVQLTPWSPGQFWEFGNYHWQKWRAGDVVTFDWQNLPHATANAGHEPRVTFQLTGRITPTTREFIQHLKETAK